MAMPKLGRNDELVLGVLERMGRAMSAYDVLDALRDEGLRAPAQVYRALDKLAQCDKVHRIESMNAFVACSHKHKAGGHAAVAFCICEDCGDVSEFALAERVSALDAVTKRSGFNARELTFEVKGQCRNCGSAV